MKRKSDEQRAQDWFKNARFHDGVEKWVAIDAFIAGLRSERRANKQKEREQAETLRRLLADEIAKRERIIVGQIAANACNAKIEGIRACIKALGFSEKGGVK